MNTQEMFKDFHTKNRQELTVLFNDFIEQDFFVNFPELKEHVSILITGSIASGFQDKNSDIDLTIFFHNQELFEKYKPLISKEFKGENGESRKTPIELHGGNVRLFESFENELELWNKDWMLREISDAIIVHDHEDKFKKLQQKYAWYPDEVFVEKINWLFAEATFLIFDRYKIAIERESLYYAENIKLKTARLFMIMLIMINKTFPKSDKHLENDLEKINAIATHKNLIDDIIKERDGKKIFEMLTSLRNEIELVLIDDNLIKKESNEFWFGLRPRYAVELEK